MPVKRQILLGTVRDTVNAALEQKDKKFGRQLASIFERYALQLRAAFGGEPLWWSSKKGTPSPVGAVVAGPPKQKTVTPTAPPPKPGPLREPDHIVDARIRAMLIANPQLTLAEARAVGFRAHETEFYYMRKDPHTPTPAERRFAAEERARSKRREGNP